MTKPLNMDDLLRPTARPSELDVSGACRSQNPTWFDGESLEAIQNAKKICTACPVRQVCLDWAISNEPHGVWGETTPKERKKLRGGTHFVTLEDRMREIERIADLRSSKTAVQLAAKYGKDQRTIFRWRAELGLHEEQVA